MSDADRIRWDERYRQRRGAQAVEPPEVFAAHADAFPIAGAALDLASGRGAAAVWLALRGLDVLGVDISPVAVDQARDLAQRAGVRHRCTFTVHDLDGGLPDGPPVSAIVCQRFRDPLLTGQIIERLAPHGVLAVSASATGRYAASPHELSVDFGVLEHLAGGSSHGQHWLLARRAPA